MSPSQKIIGSNIRAAYGNRYRPPLQGPNAIGFQAGWNLPVKPAKKPKVGWGPGTPNGKIAKPF